MVLKMHQNRWRLRLRSKLHWGSLQRFPDSLGLKGPTFKAPLSKGKGWEGKTGRRGKGVEEKGGKRRGRENDMWRPGGTYHFRAPFASLLSLPLLSLASLFPFPSRRHCYLRKFFLSYQYVFIIWSLFLILLCCHHLRTLHWAECLFCLKMTIHCVVKSSRINFLNQNLSIIQIAFLRFTLRYIRSDGHYLQKVVKLNCFPAKR